MAPVSTAATPTKGETPELEAIMQRTVHKDREQRYQSAGDIAEDLRRL